MRAVIQRVKSASVSVDGQIVSSIGKGLLCLIGVARDDTAKDTESIAKSILKLRLFPETASDESPQWKQSVVDIKGDLLCVSQFTLLALTSKGAKPDFHDAMAPNEAKTLYEQLLFRLGQSYDGKIADGRFGAMMDVSLVNWGPVTVRLRPFALIEAS
ncbi:uncharacterized protein L969DRAFT_90418 [Mixia osmundae IAM 14324]|uniref:uncharacterized protein n=1 Tax=Mixia osmundae (strain CBS 9802 / IAM 14324 / JCM 22182 / KY 12970) TaxID=764103 RepID=UPI0004A5547B|nr:uncharacterized protein L969DRAFT_90418 [Mixia osmundae IAM 14324]KEI36876.1 hypothetical protein L969DRAFT_90418 [Mixia osmundae IAM 14324]